LFSICALPSAAAFLLGFFGFLTGIMYILALLAAFPVGGAFSACAFCITKMLRDEPGYVLHDFKRKFLENSLQSAVLGMLCAVFIYAQVFIWGPLIAGNAVDLAWLIMGIVILLIFGMVAPYVFLQIAYIDLKTSQILINSILISFINAPRSFMGAITGGVIWVVFALFLPNSLMAAPLFILIGFSVSWLLCFMWVWPNVDKQFRIEETLRDRKMNETNG